MSSISGTSSLIDLIPQVRAAKNQALSQEISLAVQNKAQDLQEVQGAALLKMLNQVAAAMQGVGTQLDVRA